MSPNKKSLGEGLFQNLFASSPIPIEIYDNSGRLITVNSVCLDLFGVKSMDEIKDFLLFDDPNIPSEESERLKIGEIIKYQTKFDFELVKRHNLYKTSKSGVIYLDVLIKPLYFDDQNKKPSNYAVFVQDISERKKTELEKSKLLTNLQESVKEKEILLKEIHHRVKNNLQVISSLVILQRQTIKDPNVQRHFSEFLNRLKSISLNHEFLFNSELPNVAQY